MFCDKCGATLREDQRFCDKCGREIVGGPRWSQPRPGRVQAHVRLLGILWLALSALNAVGGLVLLVVANTVIAHIGELGGPPVPGHFLQPLLTFIATLILAKSLLGFIAGWALLQRLSWGRIMALILGFISLFNVPFGTVLGIYTLWVLLPAASEEEYERHAQAEAA